LTDCVCACVRVCVCACVRVCVCACVCVCLSIRHNEKAIFLLTSEHIPLSKMRDKQIDSLLSLSLPLPLYLFLCLIHLKFEEEKSSKFPVSLTNENNNKEICHFCSLCIFSVALLTLYFVLWWMIIFLTWIRLKRKKK